MTKNQATILACLETNVRNARTKGLRTFAETQLADFRKSLEKQVYQKPKTPAAFESFIKHLEKDNV